MIDKPIGDKHNSPNVMINNAIVKKLSEVTPSAFAKNFVAKSA